MSNPAFMSVYFEGDRNELKSLYGKMKRLQERKKPLVENDYYYPNYWLGNLVARLGADWHDVYCRGTWSDLTLNENWLFFSTETAWQPPYELLKLIKKVYPSLNFFFSAEGDDWDFYLTNDEKGRYFTSRYVIDMEPDIEYFDTIEEACAHFEANIGKPVEADFKALFESAEDWNDDHPDADWPISIKQIELVSDDELLSLSV